MPLYSRAFLTLLCGLLLLFSACKKDPESGKACDTRIYVPEDLLDWLPYFTESSSDTSLFNHFVIEDKYYFLVPQQLRFLNWSQDTQEWKLIYVQESEKVQTAQDCPVYQHVEYTLYNSKINQHMNLGFVFRDTNDIPAKEDTALYAPRIDVGTCTTAGETFQGILYGTCYSTTFHPDDYEWNSKINHLDDFATPKAVYHDVFQVNISHNPDPDLVYQIVLGKNKGIVAYFNQGVFWYLDE